MTLAAYLKKTRTPVAQFALGLGIARQTVYAWLKGERFPSRRSMQAVHDWTSGAVKMKDWA